MLSADRNDFGHIWVDTFFRAHTIRGGGASAAGSHPHLRFISRPLFRHSSHLHPAWFAN
jgi:hypothetical protein